jgi:hypothetical protein
MVRDPAKPIASASNRADGASPAMAQWFALKERHPDALLFFRMGDFFEMFFADAEAAASALDIALTHRGEHGGAPIPMCGVPVSTSDLYLARLIRRGFRVAVAEQMEDAKLRVGKAPIRRDVVRLITPGTLTEDSLLDSARPNFLLALAETAEQAGAAWLDVSTGLFETAPVPPGGLNALLGRLDPAEILAAETFALGDFATRRAPAMAAPPPLAARRRLAEAFGAASLDAFGSFSDAEAAAGALVPPRLHRIPRADGNGRGHPRKPGDSAHAGGRRETDLVHQREPLPHPARGEGARVLAIRTADRCVAHRRTAGWLGLADRQPGSSGRFAPGAAGGAGHGARAGQAILGTGLTTRCGGNPRRVGCLCRCGGCDRRGNTGRAGGGADGDAARAGIAGFAVSRAGRSAAAAPGRRWRDRAGFRWRAGCASAAAGR